MAPTLTLPRAEAQGRERPVPLRSGGAIGGPDTLPGGDAQWSTSRPPQVRSKCKKASAMMPPTEGRRIYFPEVRRAVWERFPLPQPSELQPDQVLLRAVASAVSAGTEIGGLQRHAHHLLPVVHPGRSAPADVGCAGAPRLCLCRHGRGRGERCHHSQAR